MNKKLLFLILLPSLSFANPKSIHYSALGDYLVNESGNRTHITGHPWMICYQDNYILKGWFEGAKGATIFLQTDGGNSHIIDKPVCDVFDSKEKHN